MDIKVSIYFGYHDSCITFADDEKVLLHLEAERYFRKKHIRFTSISEVEQLLSLGLAEIKATIGEVSKLYVSKWNCPYEEGASIYLLGRSFKPIYYGHHDAHIGVVLPSQLKDSLIVCADGGSEDGLGGIYLKHGDNITLLESLDSSPFNGRFYGTLAQIIVNPDCGLAHHTDAGKLMGLAGYGTWDDELYKLLVQNQDSLNKLWVDGCLHFGELFKVSSSFCNIHQDQRRCNLAFVGQEFWIQGMMGIIDKYHHLSSNISLTGGAALNVALNARLSESGKFDVVYVSPVSNDSGQSLGAMLFYNRHLKCEYPFLGRSFGDVQEMPERLLSDLVGGKFIAWYQGASEVGPRALGHRSFIGLPNSIKQRDRLSIEIKGREAYRPVAPIVADFAVHEYFEAPCMSPYMSFGFKAKQVTKDLSPAIVHVDGTARLQTLSQGDNPILHSLLKQMQSEGLPPIIMNTSFNVAGATIVDTPEDAIDQFLKSRVDILYLNGERMEA